MLYFIDINTKTIYIMAPKCGTTSIANMLNTNILNENTNQIMQNLNNPEYKKIIIIRRSIISRFLSGFYEDLFNNTCYDNMNISFYDYLVFLYTCFKEKKPNVNNIILDSLDYPLWFGNCSNLKLSITDSNGDFCSHIMSQTYALSNIVSVIECKNVQLIELDSLNKWIQNAIKCNVKEKNKEFKDVDFSQLSLSYIKSNKIIISKDKLGNKEIEMINEMYNEDYIFIQSLIDKYGICD